jgi:hypothetical protein
MHFSFRVKNGVAPDPINWFIQSQNVKNSGTQKLKPTFVKYSTACWFLDAQQMLALFEALFVYLFTLVKTMFYF